MITVFYSNGQQRDFESVADAEQDITETVIGSNFDITVDSVESEDEKDYGVEYTAKLTEV